MVSTKELENTYSQYTDKEIIELASNSNVLTQEAFTILRKEIQKRNLNVQLEDTSKNHWILNSDINNFILEQYPTVIKTYPHKPNHISNISFFLIGMGVFLYFILHSRLNIINILYFSIFDYIFLIVPFIFIYFGIKIRNKKDKMVQLIILENHILFKQQRNFGRYRLQDFHSKLISEKYTGITFDQIEDIIIPTDIFRVGSLYFLTYTGDKVYVIINYSKSDLLLVVDDLKKRIGLKN
jgi:hypothetical protein